LQTVGITTPISRLFIRHKNEADPTDQNVVAPQEPSVASVDAPKDIPDEEKPLELRYLLTRRVLMATANYSFLSLVDISVRAIQPLFLSTPIPLGGLGLDPAKIGTILSCYGILNGLAQVFFFAKVHDRYGSKMTFMSGIIAAVPVFASFPLINALAKAQGLSITVWVIVGCQVVISILLSFSYGQYFLSCTTSPSKANPFTVIISISLSLQAPYLFTSQHPLPTVLR
jgi:MFS family permease